MYIRYLPSIPRVSAIELDRHLDQLRSKTIFVGVTAVASGDLPTTTFGNVIPGVEMLSRSELERRSFGEVFQMHGGHSAEVESVAVSESGEVLASGSDA